MLLWWCVVSSLLCSAVGQRVSVAAVLVALLTSAAAVQVGNEVFLKGLYLELGIHSSGSFGTRYCDPVGSLQRIGRVCAESALHLARCVVVDVADSALAPSGFNGKTGAVNAWGNGLGFIAGAVACWCGRSTPWH